MCDKCGNTGRIVVRDFVEVNDYETAEFSWVEPCTCDKGKEEQ